MDSQIEVILDKLNGDVLELKVDSSMTLLELRQLIDERWQIPALSQRLLYGDDIITDKVDEGADMQGQVTIIDCLDIGRTSVSLTVTSSEEQVYQFLAHANPELVCLALQTVGRMQHMDHERAVMAVKAVLDEHSLSLSSKVHLAAAEVLAKMATRHDGKGLDTLNTLVRRAVRNDGHALLLYPYECWDVDSVLAAIPKKPGYAFISFWNNEKVETVFDQKQFVMEAVEKSPLILEYASQELKADKEIVLRAVQRNWRALQYASGQPQADPDIVNVAVAQNGLALQFAADKINDNRDFIIKIVTQHPHTLKFASKRLRADDVVTAYAYAAFAEQQRNL